MRKIKFPAIYIIVVIFVLLITYVLQSAGKGLVPELYWTYFRAAALFVLVFLLPLFNRRIRTIAHSVLKEEIRKKTLYVILLFMVLIVGIIHIFGKIAPGNQHIFVSELGLSGMTMFGLLFGIFMASTAIYKEMEKKTVYVMLSYPVSRQEIVMGKFIGNVISVTMFSCVLSAVFIMSLLLRFGFEKFEIMLVYSCIGLMMEFMVIVAIAITTSTLLSTISNFIFVFIIFVLGHMTEQIIHITSRVEADSIKSAGKILLKIIPDFSRFEFKDMLNLGEVVDVNTLISSFGYALLYCALMVSIGMLIFRKREVDRL
ncbi:MAG: ABC transporter permease subunit [Candidatus Aureabacteria bacterium]|nr:ABC transporter permease subunit [Candidatus Auribacterota bacterium]